MDMLELTSCLDNAGFRKALDDTGMSVPMATTNLFTDPVFKDGAFTSHDARVRAYAVQKTMRAMDLGVELGARTYVFWGGREGAEVDAAKDPVEAIKWFRDALNFLCEYARDQQLRPAVRARGQAERAARRYLLPHDGRVSRVHPDAGASGDGRRQPGGRARAHGRAELLPRGRAGDRGGQALSHRPQRSEARPLRSGSAVRLRVDQGRCSSWSSCSRTPATTARATSTRTPTARGRGRRLGLRRAAACGPI